MRIPKTIKMFGFDWKVIIDKKSEGGSLKWEEKEIKLGDRCGEAENIFLHEIMEAILLSHLHRYYTNDATSEYQFIFNHSEFVKIINHFYQIIKDNRII